MKQIYGTKKLHLCIYGIIAIFYFWMAAQIPYTHDDWDWGLDIGLDQLLHATVNSRYVGNFFEVVMTRSELLKIVIMGSCYFLIPWCLSKIAVSLHPRKDENLVFFYFLLCNILLFTMNRSIWRQTYSWIAGFANFAISAVFMMPWLKELCRVLRQPEPVEKHSLPYLLYLLVMSICSQLFLENLAIFHVLLGVFLCVVSFIRNKKITFNHLLMLFGSILGLIIMFSSSLYDTLFSNGAAINEYRQIPMFQGQSFVNVMLHILKVAASLISQLYAQNFTISLLIVVALIILLSRHKEHLPSQHYRLADCINRILLIALICCSVLNTAMHLLAIEQASTYMKLFQLPISVLFFCGVNYELYLIFRNDTKTMLRMFTFWLCPPVAIAPLVMTTETGYRLFFTTNILLIFFLLNLLNYILVNNTNTTYRRIVPVLSCAVAFCLIFHGVIYAHIGMCKREREQIINQSLSANETVIVLPEYPYPNYLHEANPINEARIEYFKDFYLIPDHVTVIFEGE